MLTGRKTPTQPIDYIYLISGMAVLKDFDQKRYLGIRIISQGATRQPEVFCIEFHSRNKEIFVFLLSGVSKSLRGFLAELPTADREEMVVKVGGAGWLVVMVVVMVVVGWW